MIQYPLRALWSLSPAKKARASGKCSSRLLHFEQVGEALTGRDNVSLHLFDPSNRRRKLAAHFFGAGATDYMELLYIDVATGAGPAGG